MTRRGLPLIPDACSLARPEFEERVDTLRREFLPQLVAHGATASAQWFEFPSALRSELEDLVEFERRCCETLHWSIEHTGEDRVRLVVRGVSPEQRLLRIIDREAGS